MTGRAKARAMRVKAIFGAALCALGVSGCTTAGLSGAGSMRVEIDVYEGPVGQSASVNVGQISALLDDTLRAIVEKRDLAITLQAQYCATQYSASERPDRVVSRGFRDCQMLVDVISSARVIAGNFCNYDRPSEGGKAREDHAVPDELIALPIGAFPPASEVVDLCAGTMFRLPAGARARSQYWRDPQRLAQLAEQMRLVATRMTESYVGYVPKNQEVRLAIQDYAYLLDSRAAELKNRSYILQKQVQECVDFEVRNWLESTQEKRPVRPTLEEIEKDKFKLDTYQTKFRVYRSKVIAKRLEGLDLCSRAEYLAAYNSTRARKYPTGDYLRGSQPSRFIEAFDWFNANLSARGTGAYLRRNRVRAIRALSEERHWERVNEVFHSGQGDVSAAFIKDELGNWSLKSYSNEPGKLLDAYTDVFNATIKTAVDLAGNPASIGGATDALGFADRVATGKKSAAASIGTLELAQFRKRTVDRLTAAQEAFAQERAAIKGEDEKYKDRKDTIAYWTKTKGEADAALEVQNRALEELRNSKVRANIVYTDCLSSNPDDAAPCAEAKKLNDSETNAYNAQKVITDAARQDARTASNNLAAAQATEKNITDRAVATAERILADYQADLSLMRQTITPKQPENKPEAPTQ